MLHETTIEINEVDVKVEIYFHNEFGEIVIDKMIDEDGNAIAPDLHDELISDYLYQELHEMYADRQADKTRFAYAD